MTTSTTTNPSTDVAPPAGWHADHSPGWEPGDGDDIRPWRLVYSAERTVTNHDAEVQLRAIQYADGTLAEAEVLLNGDDELSSDQARELAAALIEAADELDGVDSAITPDASATTWRDLTDQLEPHQIDYLEQWEQKFPDMVEAALLEARGLVKANRVTRRIFDGVDAPAGAFRVFEAQRRQDGTWFREFSGTSRDVAGVSVFIEGEQYPDGSVTRVLSVSVDDLTSGPGGVLSIEQARQFAAAVAEAADELDRLS
jgi:hypothetical protein